MPILRHTRILLTAFCLPAMLWLAFSVPALAQFEVQEEDFPSLLKLLESADPALRNAAMIAINQIGGPATAPAIPLLEKQLNDAQQGHPHTAAAVLSRIGAEAVPALIRGLDNPVPRCRIASVNGLLWLGEKAAPARDRLLLALRDPEADVRITAAQALAAIGISDQGVLLGLDERLKDPDYGVRNTAAYALAALKEPGLNVLRENLRDGSEETRDAVYLALQNMNEVAAPALDELISIAVAGGEDRNEAWETAARLAEGKSAELGKLGAALDKLEGKALEDALVQLGELSEFSKLKLRASYLRALKDPAPWTRLRAAKALQSIGESPQEVHAVIEEVMESGDEKLMLSAADFLAELGEDISPFFSARLDSPDPSVQAQALYVLGHLGEDSVPSLPKMIGLLNSTTYPVPMTAAEALGALGPIAAPAVPALIEAMSRGDYVLRYTCITSLGQIGPAAAPDAVPQLIPLLALDDVVLVQASIEALGNMGPAASAALPALELLFSDDEFGRIAKMAAEAIAPPVKAEGEAGAPEADSPATGKP